MYAQQGGYTPILALIDTEDAISLIKTAPNGKKIKTVVSTKSYSRVGIDPSPFFGTRV